MTKSNAPLIAHGTFGTHLLGNSNGKFSFFGEVPCGAPSFNDYESGLEWLANFIRNMEDKDKQRELAIASTPELFALIIKKLNHLDTNANCVTCDGARTVPVVKYYAGNVGVITDEECHACGGSGSH